MNTFKLIIKGVLFYVTVLIACLTLVGIDSIIAKGYLLNTILLNVALIILCIKFLNKQDIKNVTVWKDIDSNFN